MDASLLKEGERIDDLQRNGRRIIQDPKNFCFGVDAVLLSWFAKAEPGEKVVDLCTGTGIVPILMDARYKEGDYTGIEIQHDMADMFHRSILLNGVSDHMRSVEGDAKEASALLGRDRFDVLTVNPPYMASGAGLENPDSAKRIARHEILITLSDVAREAARLLKTKGRFYMVHRPERLTEIFAALTENHLQPARLIFVHPYADKNASMVLISAVKDGRNGLKTEPPIIMYREKQQYSDVIRKIYEE